MTNRQPRIEPLPQEEWTDAAREVFAFWEGEEARQNGSKSNTMMTLANHPKLAVPLMGFGKHILVHSTMTPRQKELIVLRIAWAYGCEYEWAHHVHSGRQIGLIDSEFAALQVEDASSLWSAEDQALIGATDQLCREGRIDESAWGALAAFMNRHELMDFLYTVGFFRMNATAFRAMGIQLEPGFEEFSKPAREMVAE